MRNTHSALVLVVCSVAVSLSATAAEKRMPDIVVKKDGTRVEGRVSDEKFRDFVTVRQKRTFVRVKRDDIEAIVTAATPLHEKFRYDPTPKYLALLASRAGKVIPLEEAEKILSQTTKHASKTEVADLLLKALRLRPEDTKEVVGANIAAFEKKHGARAVVYESDHYVVLSTLDMASVRRIAVRMDGIFREYSSRLVFSEKIGERFVVKVYRDRREYLSTGAPAFSAAYFSSRDRELVGYKTSSFDEMFRPLYHEGMHQFLHFYVPNPPTWFDEGLAKYFETAKPQLGRRLAGKPSYHVGGIDRYQARYVRDHQSELMPLPKLFRMSRQEFYTVNTSLNYAQAWAFTHFLLESGNKRLKQMWIDYFFELRDGATGEEANEAVFGKINMPGLEAMFSEYVRRL